MSGFSHDLAGGDGNLNITSFQNPTYVPGTNGWQVTKEGSAEFNNVTVRGTVEAGFFIGYGDAGEILIYTGNPQTDPTATLLLSVSSAAGADPFGFAYGLGFYLYGPEGAVIGLSDNGSQPVLAMRPPGVKSLTLQPLIFSAAFNAGLANEYQWIVMSSGKSGGNADAALQLQGESADKSVAAAVIVEFGGVVNAIFTPTALEMNVPIIADTWHPMALASPWANQGGSGVPCQYRKVASPPNTVEVIGELLADSVTSGMFATLPYAPVHSQPFFVQSSTTSVYTGACTTGGALEIGGSAIVNGTYTFHGFISLDA